VKDHAKIAVIVLNYNNWNDTIECVDSLLNNTYENFEVVIVDNKSTNDSIVKIKGKYDDHNQVKIIVSSKNSGYAGGNNIGIEYALRNEADYILVINNDTILPNTLLADLIHKAQEKEQIGVISTKIMFSDDKTLWYAGGYFSPKKASGYHIGIGEADQGQYDEPKEVQFLTGCLLFIPKQIIDDVGYLDDVFFLYGEDLDYSLKVLRKGYKLYYEPSMKIIHKVSASHKKSDEKVSPILMRYSNRNRFIICKRWLKVSEKFSFFIYFILSRLFLSIMNRNRVFLSGIAEGINMMKSV
jgi:GT2 family glycosyltransferase